MTRIRIRMRTPTRPRTPRPTRLRTPTPTPARTRSPARAAGVAGVLATVLVACLLVGCGMRISLGDVDPSGSDATAFGPSDALDDDASPEPFDSAPDAAADEDASDASDADAALADAVGD